MVYQLISDSTSNPNDVKQFAVVVFEHEKDYSTALLLGNARIIDSPINGTHEILYSLNVQFILILKFYQVLKKVLNNKVKRNNLEE